MKITQQIWGKSDTVLFIFAGAAAEFSLNKAVDWLYFTGKLPRDPLRRLFETVQYAQRILFLDQKEADKAIAQITAIHKGVEQKRGKIIPDWAYRDVLYMLIYYSIASFELLERALTADEKEEVFQAFKYVGEGMKIPKLPSNYENWRVDRNRHLRQDLSYGKFTNDLYTQYSKHLGWWRFALLVVVQKMLIPPFVRRLLLMRRPSKFKVMISIYKSVRAFRISTFLKNSMMPKIYQKQIQNLNMYSNEK